ncbi:hypothetical protein AB0N07_22635 [Streptomyces sp. NPDC051172]
MTQSRLGADLTGAFPAKALVLDGVMWPVEVSQPSASDGAAPTDET